LIRGAAKTGDPNDWTFVYTETELTTCKVCWRKAQVPFGYAGANMAMYHMWIKCDFGESGLGEIGGAVPGVAPGGGNESPAPLPLTGINDHSGQTEANGSMCVEIDVNACCIARQMAPRPTGLRCGPTFNCNTFVFDAITHCGSDSKRKIIDKMEEGTLVEKMYKNAPSWIGFRPF